MNQPIGQGSAPGRECWAACLGDCQGSLSKEHVISKAVFDEAVLEVEGIHAFGDTSKIVALSSLTARMLCRGHNSRLSSLDVEATRLSDAIKAARAGTEHVVHRVNGALLERWVLKVLVNLLASRWTEKGYLPPGPGIVSKVFGLAALTAPSGLYVLHDYQGSIPPDSVSYCVIMSTRDSKPQVLGLILSLSGVCFALSVCRRALDDILRDHSPFGPFITTSAMTALHPSRALFGNRGQEPILTVEFDWGQSAVAERPEALQDPR